MSLESTISPSSEDWAIPSSPKLSEHTMLSRPSRPSTPSSVIQCIDEAPAIPGKNTKCVVSPIRTRHSKYYIDEQMAIFLVDNHLYKVHRHFLRRESLKFNAMFDCLPPDQSGQTDENPIVLSEVTRGEFEALLEYFYTGLFFKAAENNPRSLQEYTDLLSIATRYECTDARRKAIDGIESLRPSPVQRIVLAEKFNVLNWLEPAYIELCERAAPLGLYEGEQLGLEKVILVALAREKVRSPCAPQDTNWARPATGVFGRIPGPILETPTPQSWSRTPSPTPRALPEIESRVSRIVKEVFFPPPPPWFPQLGSPRPVHSGTFDKGFSANIDSDASLSVDSVGDKKVPSNSPMPSAVVTKVKGKKGSKKQ
ncbi:hypothetical protein L218DRAFT_1081574 [Marasmius fiardii PR-910]|nr:hypothetical protein L218DRAFT_1081574 [Marasmius fiardii PR-910]